MQLKGPQRQKQTHEQNEQDWASSAGLRRRLKPQHLHHMKGSSREQQPRSAEFGRCKNRTVLSLVQVSWLVYGTQSTTRDYIRAEGDFRKEIYSWKDQQGRNERRRVRKWRLVRRISGMKYSWKGHKDRNGHKNRMKRSGQAWLGYVKDINRNIPTTWRWACGNPAWRRRWKQLYYFTLIMF